MTSDFACGSVDYAVAKREAEGYIASASLSGGRKNESLQRFYSALVKALLPSFEPHLLEASWFGRFALGRLVSLRNEVGGEISEQLSLVPFAVELTAGCSVGCWYCGLDAKILSTSRFSDAEACLLKMFLAQAADVFGPWACKGILYWATDPFDAAHYELASDIFESILGIHPTLSTALGAENPERLRHFVNLRNASRCAAVRVSVQTYRQFESICANFSAEDARFIAIDIKLKGSPVAIANVGRARRHFDLSSKAREKEKIKRGIHFDRYGELPPETISCVLGVILNLPEKTLKLVEPCSSNIDPNGYRTVAQQEVSTGFKLRDWIADAIRHF